MTFIVPQRSLKGRGSKKQTNKQLKNQPNNQTNTAAVWCLILILRLVGFRITYKTPLVPSVRKFPERLKGGLGSEGWSRNKGRSKLSKLSRLPDWRSHVITCLPRSRRGLHPSFLQSLSLGVLTQQERKAANYKLLSHDRN